MGSSLTPSLRLGPSVIAEAGLALGEGEVILKILSEPLGRGGCLGERPGEKSGKAAQSWAPGMT